MRKLGFAGALEFWNDTVRQHFAEFDAPLVERVDIPDSALNKDLVLVERDELAKCLRSQTISKDCVRGRLPSKVRCGTWKVWTPSAATSSAVLPNASASV